MASQIRSCSPCRPGQAAFYQDRAYGLGRRVMNEMKEEKLRCTVCGKETKA